VARATLVLLLMLALPAAARTFNVDGVQYHEAGDPGAPLVFLLHGTPGSSRAFNHLLNDERLIAARHLIAVDRPGFGASASLPPARSFADQVPLLDPALKRNRSDVPAVVAGHSLGGSIAYRVAVDRPEAVGALVIISSSLSPRLGRPRWYNRLAAIPGVRYVVPANLMRANDEMMPLSRELKAIEPSLAAIAMPVTIIHGARDKLVSVRNLDFAQERLSAANLTLIRAPKAGHFLLWEQAEIVVEALLATSPNTPCNVAAPAASKEESKRPNCQELRQCNAICRGYPRSS